MSSAALRLAPLVTEEEFFSLPESLEHIELLDGEIVVSPAPSPLHQLVVLELGSRLHAWARQHPPAAVGLAPLDLRVAPGRVLQPDLFLALGGFSARATPPLTLIPDLVVEVVSGRRSYDRITKRAIYAEAGVPEYWIVDPLLSVVERVVGDQTQVFAAGARLESVVAPGLAVEVSELFPA